MKLRFFGDSWYYTWYHGPDMFPIKSTKLKKKMVSHGFPIYELYANGLGIECINKTKPKKNFYQTTKDIITSVDNEGITYNIVFFSSLIRNVKETVEVYNYDITNKKNFLDKYRNDTIKSLEQIQEFAKTHNQQFIFIGGQSTLHRSVFDLVKEKDNLHLLVEDALSYLQQRSHPWGIFKLSDDFSYEITDDWDKDLVIQIADEQEKFLKLATKKWASEPDPKHINAAGAFVMFDMILYTIEKLEGEKL